jgi:hypothetical protein
VRRGYLKCLGATLLFLSVNALAGEREKQIDFDDEIIEGINQQSVDSLTQLAEKDDRKSTVHLYEKRKSFREETRETLRDLAGDLE